MNALTHFFIIVPIYNVHNAFQYMHQLSLSHYVGIS